MAACLVPAARGQGDPGSYDTCDQSAVLFQAFSRDDPGISYELQPRSDPDIGGRASVRWYKIQMNGWPQSGQQPTSPAEWGEIEVPSDWSAYFPSIAVDSLNNAAITFNVSGTDKFISMWQAHKCAGEAQFRPAFEVKAGQASYEYTPMGWGDYSGTNPDPIAPAIFWGHAQCRKVQQARQTSGTPGFHAGP